MKNLKEFSAHSNYTAFLQTADYITPNVSLCVTENEVHYNPYVAPSYNLLDILYSDANGNLSVDSNVLPASEGKTPIGLCVAATGFFGSYEPARFMSLKWMNYTTPESGSISKQGMKMGQYGVDIATIPNITTTYNGGSDWGYLTSDWITGTENKIPSLFDANNNWNTSILGTVNEFAVTDINGKAKTAKWLEAATAQPNWKTDSTITNSQESGYSPAACCCYRYHTLGTSAGDWYLGADGEMAMINVLRNEINTKLTAINTVYSSACMSSIPGAGIWSSTEYGSSGAYFIGTRDGSISYDLKINDFNVLALFAY